MTESLSSWHDTPAKRNVLAFVKAVTAPNSPDHVPVAERIAVFDNDGTLWCERPLYPQIAFAFHMFAEKAKQEPGLRDQQPFKAALAGDTEWLKEHLSIDTLPAFIEMGLRAAAGTTQHDFELQATTWLANTFHPHFGVPYASLVYKPMVELVKYLQHHAFQLFISSGGGMDFVRLFSEEAYGIPRQNVIGSNMVLTWEKRDDGPVLVRQAGLVEPFNEGPGKPINIQLHVGRPPILTAGNSNGDLQMMEFAAANRHSHLNLLLRHDDADREFAYDQGAERIQQMAQECHWTTISMKRDFKRIFADGIDTRQKG